MPRRWAERLAASGRVRIRGVGDALVEDPETGKVGAGVGGAGAVHRERLGLERRVGQRRRAALRGSYLTLQMIHSWGVSQPAVTFPQAECGVELL